MRVSRRTLMLLAGAVWLIAGANILRIGVKCWLSIDTGQGALRLGAICVFVPFALMFQKIFGKHSRRIAAKGDSGHSPLAIFDGKGWALMAFMIALGVTVRRLQLLPPEFIAAFYTGLSAALILTALRFILASRR